MEVTNQNTAGKVQNKVQCPSGEHFPDEHSAPMEEKSKHSEADVKNRGDCKQETQKSEKPATIEETTSDTSHTRTQEASETTVSHTQDNKKDDQIYGLKSEKNGEFSVMDNTDCQSGDATASSSQRGDFSNTTHDRDSSATDVLSVAEGHSPDNDDTQMEKKNVLSQADGKQSSPKNEKQVTIEPKSDESHITKNEASELITSQILNDEKDEQVDEPKSELKEKTSATNNSDNQSGDKFSEGKTQSTNTNQDGSCEENLDDDQAHSQEHTVTAATASSSQRGDFSDTTHDRVSSATDVLSVAEGHSPNNDDTQMEKKNVLSQADGKQSSPKNEKQVTIEPKSDESHMTKNEASELITSQILNDEKDEQVDEPKSELKEKTSATNNSDNQSGDTSKERRDKHESTTQDKQQLDDRSNDVETIGPTTPEATQPEVPQVPGGSGKYLIAVAIVAIVAILVHHFLQPESPPQTNDVRQIDVFLRQLEKVKTQFPNQRAELWNRSRIHLKRHLQTAQPTEPVSLILTAGLRAEKTLNCLAQGLATAFSSALNASVLHIDGASKASQDSDQVKLDIDRKLQGAFEGDKPVAVIHRFEELPPGSTLIFYRYCDHENAAYKKTFLIFTVLLGEEDEIPAKISLCAVEEMVDDHLQKKFLTHGHPVSFDMMDLDKYGGLWSRISHLILPVAAEERIEVEGC